MRILINNYGLLLYPDGKAEKVSHCTTFTEPEVQVLQFETEQDLIDYCGANCIELPE